MMALDTSVLRLSSMPAETCAIIPGKSVLKGKRRDDRQNVGTAVGRGGLGRMGSRPFCKHLFRFGGPRNNGAAGRGREAELMQPRLHGSQKFFAAKQRALCLVRVQWVFFDHT